MVRLSDLTSPDPYCWFLSINGYLNLTGCHYYWLKKVSGSNAFHQPGLYGEYGAVHFVRSRGGNSGTGAPLSSAFSGVIFPSSSFITLSNRSFMNLRRHVMVAVLATTLLFNTYEHKQLM